MSDFLPASGLSHRADTSASEAPPVGNAELADWLCQSDRARLVSYLTRALGGNRSQAEDMAQEALTRIVVSSRQYGGARARGLLYTIARNLLVDHYREETAQAKALQTLGVIGEAIDTRNPLHDLVARQDVDRVRDAIISLPPRCRQVFMLNRYEQMSYSAIARHCRISVSMVEKHINRALRQLVHALEDATTSEGE